MITAKQEKNKTTIIIPRRLRKRELEKAIEYFSYITISPKKATSKAKIQQLADEVNGAVWERFKKLKRIK